MLVGGGWAVGKEGEGLTVQYLILALAQWIVVVSEADDDELGVLVQDGLVDLEGVCQFGDGVWVQVHIGRLRLLALLVVVCRDGEGGGGHGEWFRSG